MPLAKLNLDPAEVTGYLGELMLLMVEHARIGDQINDIRHRLRTGVQLGPGQAKCYQLPGFNATITEKDGKHVFSFISIEA